MTSIQLAESVATQAANYTCAESTKCTRRATTTATIDHVVVWSCGRPHAAE